MKLFYSVVFIFLFASIGYGQVNLKDYQRAEQFIASNISKKYYRSFVRPQWQEQNKILWYSINTKKGTEYLILNLKKGMKSPLFDQEKLAVLLRELGVEDVKAFELPISNIKLDEHSNHIRFKQDTSYFNYNIDANTLKLESSKKSENPLSVTSPDKSKMLFVKDYNLWLKDVNTNDSIQITFDGKKRLAYAVSPSWYSTKDIESVEDHDLDVDINWSPNNRFAIIAKYDRREARNLYLYKTSVETGFRSKVHSYERPLAGDSLVATVSYLLFDVEKKSLKELDLKPLAVFLPYGFQWSEDGAKAYQVRYRRGYQSVEVVQVDASQSKVKLILEEKSETYVDPMLHNLKLFATQTQFLWLSERDGWNHIYRYSTDGVFINQVTKGSFIVRSVDYIDEKAKKIYFTAGGEELGVDPYYPLLYVINFDGTGLKLLTSENAHHSISLSPDKKYFVDNYSTVQEPNIALLRRLKDGKIIAEIEKGDISELLKMGWQKPETFVLKGRDGKTDIYGVFFKPFGFDVEKKYPIIEGTYSGPHTIRAPKTFARGLSNDDLPMTQLGFVLINIDGMGTAFRSKAFHNVSYRNLGDIGGPDKMIVMKTLAKNNPWMDISRVGIFGHSAGGYDAAHALLAYPDFYKVAVAVAGNHDHRSAKAWWPELYMGYPAGNNYDEQSNYFMADKLKGKLLLVHGDMDQNVNTASSIRFASELQKANKDYELIIIPNKDHSQTYYDKYLQRKRWDFFVRYLHGIQPPKEYKIK